MNARRALLMALALGAGAALALPVTIAGAGRCSPHCCACDWATNAPTRR